MVDLKPKSSLILKINLNAPFHFNFLLPNQYKKDCIKFKTNCY